MLWRVPLDGAPVAIVEENSRIRVFPVAGGHRRVDVEVRLRALRRGVAIAGTDDEKGYGGLSMRFANGPQVQLAGDGRVLRATPAGIEAGESVEFQLARAVAARGPLASTRRCTVDGRPWTRWVLRQEPSMQNCAFPGSQPGRAAHRPGPAARGDPATSSDGRARRLLRRSNSTRGNHA